MTTHFIIKHNADFQRLSHAFYYKRNHEICIVFNTDNRMKAPHKYPMTRAYIAVLTMLSLGIGLSDYTRMKAVTSDTFLAVFHMIFVLSLVIGSGYLIYLLVAYCIIPKLKQGLNSKEREEQIQTVSDDSSINREQIMENILSYASLTFERHLSKSQVETLCGNINLLAQGKDVSADIMVRMEGVTTNDLYHFGWNVGKRLRRTNIQIAWFLKETFKAMFSDVAIETIQTKLAIKEGTFSLKLIPLDQSLTPHRFPSPAL